MNENEQRINEICEMLKNLEWYRGEAITLPLFSKNSKSIFDISKKVEICLVYIEKLEKELIKLLEQANKNTQTNSEE